MKNRKINSHLALTINTNIVCFVIASRSIDDLQFVSVIESFTMWHTIQFAWVWSF